MEVEVKKWMDVLHTPTHPSTPTHMHAYMRTLKVRIGRGK
jgi:hypothetical protein